MEVTSGVTGGVGSTPPSHRVGTKMTLGASQFGFPLPEENYWLLLCEELPPLVGASFLIVGTTKGHVLIGFKTLRIFKGTFFEEEVFSLLH